MSGAIQVGIWESLYEQSGTPLSVGSGYFSTAGLTHEGSQLLDLVFEEMSVAPALPNKQVRWFSTSDGQDLIGDPVPVPAPLALLGAGLGLLAFGRRARGRR
jgi:hypothetical protein